MIAQLSELERKYLCSLFLMIAKDEKSSDRLMIWKILHTKFSGGDNINLRFNEGEFVLHLIKKVRARLEPQLQDNTKDHYLRAKTLDAGLDSVYSKITTAIEAEKVSEDGKGHDDQVQKHDQGQEYQRR
jgi:hypothetical protein